jgi:hypothetical protein
MEGKTDCPQGSHFVPRGEIRNWPLRAWSLIPNEKPIVLFERHCHETDKSEAIAYARRFLPSGFTDWWTPNE